MSSVRGSCLCGDVAWELTGPLEFMSHCHCARCRKAHGAAFATYLMCAADAFRLVRGQERVTRYESSPGFFRPFCSRCGSVVPDGEPWQGLVGVPAGALDDDPGVRPLAHIFVGSKAPWMEVGGGLPAFEGYPPGFGAPAIPDLPASGTTTGVLGGSCLCQRVAFVVTGPSTRCVNCHCSRCRKARSAAQASNLVVKSDAVRFTRGDDQLASYKVPGARFFMQVFCRSCGSPMPRVDRERDIAVIPMGVLDADPGRRPEWHIFVASKAPWYEIPDGLPQHAEYEPAA